MAVQPAIAFFTLFFWWSTFGFVALELSLQPPEPGGTFSVDKKSYEGLEKVCKFYRGIVSEVKFGIQYVELG